MSTDSQNLRYIEFVHKISSSQDILNFANNVEVGTCIEYPRMLRKDKNIDSVSCCLYI
jgi:hypothetical protein